MGKALVINGANFAQNKITTVGLIEIIACTGLSISNSTWNFNTIGATKQLTITKTPVNTNEDVTWISSNPSAISVSSSGLMTCNTVGTAVISVYCGSKVATCYAIHSVTINANNDLDIFNGVAISRNSSRDYTGGGTGDRYRTYGADGNVLSGYRAISNGESTYANIYPIPFPEGATKIYIAAPSSFSTCYISLLNSQSLCTYNLSSANKGARCLYFEYMSPNSVWLEPQGGGEAHYWEFDVGLYRTEEVDSMIFCLSCASGTLASSISGDVTLKFY